MTPLQWLQSNVRTNQTEVGHGGEGKKTSGNEYVFKNLGAGGRMVL